jgi:hypothetical protein
VTAHARLEHRFRDVDDEQVVLGRLEGAEALGEDRERTAAELERRIRFLLDRINIQTDEEVPRS